MELSVTRNCGAEVIMDGVQSFENPFRIVGELLADRPGADQQPILTDEQIERVADLVYEGLKAKRANQPPLVLVPVRRRPRRKRSNLK
jgi:hypothetical protein